MAGFLLRALTFKTRGGLRWLERCRYKTLRSFRQVGLLLNARFGISIKRPLLQSRWRWAQV